jgi:ribosome-associated toxin RatA of RatAB toxin-antitoxin module
MSNKEIEKHICRYCESDFKIIFNFEEVSGYPKFCPFCSEELNDDQDDDELDTYMNLDNT